MIIQHAKDGVRYVLCPGETIYANGKFRKVGQTGVLGQLHEKLSRASSSNEVQRR